MSTQKQIKANRQNSKKSTGPKTDEGKAAVSQNAVKHGLFAQSVLTCEDPAEYEAFHDNMLAELAPAGAVESMLAERIVGLWWRLRRAERMQNEVIEDMIGSEINNEDAKYKRECYYVRQGIYKGDPRMVVDDLPLGRIAINDWKYSKILDRMLMYERRIENSVIKMMKELKRFQTIRRIEREDAEQRQSTSSLRLRTGQAPFIRYKAAGPMAGQKKGDLKKQSQFVPGRNGATSDVKEDYDNNPLCGAQENKANRTCTEHVEWSQSQAIGRKFGVPSSP